MPAKLPCLRWLKSSHTRLAAPSVAPVTSTAIADNLTPHPSPFPIVSRPSPAQPTEVPSAELAMPSSTVEDTSGIPQMGFSLPPSAPQLVTLQWSCTLYRWWSTVSLLLVTALPQCLVPLVPWTAPVMGTPESVLVLHLTLPPPVFDPNMSTLESLLESLGLPRLGILPPPYLHPL